ncbi:MAG: hypothetical protein ACUVRM_00055 [Bacillota bacterium]
MTAVDLEGKAAPDTATIKRIQGLTSVQSSGNNVFEIRYRSPRSQEALRGVRELLSNLKEYNEIIQSKEINATLSALRHEIAEREKELLQLKSDDPTREAVSMLLAQLRLDEARLRACQASLKDRIEVLEEPALIGEIARERALFNLYFGLFWGLVAGVGLAYLLEYRYTRLKGTARHG